MAVRVFTDRPAALLSALKEAIANDRITTWVVDDDGDLTYAAARWANRAWMRPKILEDRVLFNIIAPTGEQISRTTYGIYHGRLIQTLLNHLDSQFRTAVATALPTTGDSVGE